MDILAETPDRFLLLPVRTKQDVGSTVGELPTTEELIAQARKLLSMSPHGVAAR